MLFILCMISCVFALYMCMLHVVGVADVDFLLVIYCFGCLDGCG